MNPQTWWYVARASGIVAWLLLTASVIWGIVLAAREFPGRGRPAWLLDLHRWLGGLTVSFVVIHLGALVADTYVHFDLADLLVPMASSWRRGAVALGVVAVWALAAVEITSLMMKRLPRRMWRAVHLTSYATFWLASVHGALAGTDRSAWLYQVTACASIVAVVWAVSVRVLGRRSGRRLNGAGRPATS